MMAVHSQGQTLKLDTKEMMVQNTLGPMKLGRHIKIVVTMVDNIWNKVDLRLMVQVLMDKLIKN